MRLDKDDPRLMDYVLGELKDDEAQTLAAALEEEQNKDARDLVDELRGVANTTRRILREGEASNALTDEQRAAIVEQAHAGNITPFNRVKPSLSAIQWLSAAAILVILASFTLVTLSKFRQHETDLAAIEVWPSAEVASGRYIQAEHALPQIEVLAETPGDDFWVSDEPAPESAPPLDGSLRVRGHNDGLEALDLSNFAHDQLPVESRTRLGVQSDFNDDISPYIEYDQYGEAGTTIVEAKKRIEMRANLNEGLSLTYESDGGAPAKTPPPATPPETEQWAEYNVGNLTGQTEISELASNIPDDEATGRSLGADREVFREPWQWNTPDAKPTEIVGGPGTETYVKVAGVKPFLAVRDEPLSTFSIDVDTAAYSNVRRFLNQGHLPPPDAVRIEEMINYFAYAYPQPVDGRPFAVNVMGAPAPWAPQHRLVRIGVKGREVPQSERPPANLVFLLDVSGSMGDANKLPLVKESMKTLLGQLRPNDRVAIVTYAGDARKVLDPTPCSEPARIVQAIDSLQSGGGTNGAGGIEMAYDLAQSGFIRGGINRVIIATDGDFNVGVTSHGDLMTLIEARAKSGVFLTTLGFGMGNLKDATLEQLANRGNGNYAYIDNHAEARRALVDQLAGTLQTIAKDVKIQVEFNPARVSHYRLLGYENRALANRDFNDDTKDAGEIGAGHTVTALYEIIPAGSGPAPGVDPLKYQATEPNVDPLKYGAAPTNDSENPILPGPEPTPRPDIAPLPEWLTVKLRYKEPEASESIRLDVPLVSVNNDLREADADFRFASAVAAFGQVLRHTGYRHPSNFDRIIEMARAAGNGDPDREAFVDLVITAKTLTGSR